MTSSKNIVVGLVLLGGVLLLAQSCGESGPSRVRTGGGRRSAGNAKDDSALLVEAIVRGLNNLPAEVAVQLRPPENILDDSKSMDGQEVLATCSVTPGVPDSPYNFLEVPRGNAGFRSLRVKPGDLVRYFAKYTQEDEEYGVQELTYFELKVRRLYENNPQNALIIEGGLTGPLPYPTRIEIWRLSDKRMLDIRNRLMRYTSKPEKMIAWEPSPDETALSLLRDRLNQWFRNLPESEGNWEPEALVETLPKRIQEAGFFSDLLSAEGQRNGLFQEQDPRFLQQAIWTRDIAQWANGYSLQEIDIAVALFDWTVRNIQLDNPRWPAIVHHPWQALMYGHGTSALRAWVFAELCRQQQLDVVMLGLATASGKSPTKILPALFLDGKFYLFEPELGIPLPGETVGSVASLSEILANPELLRKLDIDEERTYPLSESDLKHIEVQLVCSPLQISRRVSALQPKLVGENFAVFSSDNRRLSEEVSKHSDIKQVKLWAQPFQAFLDELSMDETQRTLARNRFFVFAQRPRLWKARVLHFQGTKDIPSSQRNDPLATPDLGHERATELYMDPRIRPSDKVLARLSGDKQRIYGRTKIDASYWLGLLRYDLGDPQVAVTWLKNMTLEADPNGPWVNGATYNLARAYESLGQVEEAISLLESDHSPQSYGNALRATRLRQHFESSSDDPEE